MVARNGGEALRQTVTNDHTDADRVDKLFHFGRHISSRRGKDVGVFQANLLAHETQNGLVDKLIFKFQGQRNTLSATQIFDVSLPSYAQCVLENLALNGIGLVNSRLDGNIYLLPKARNGTHTRWMRLAHALLYLVRIGVDDELCALR